MLNFKIFNRKFDIGLMGYRLGPKPSLNLKDRQQGIRPVLVSSQYNGNYFFPHNDPYVYYIPLKTEIMAFL